MTGEDGAIAGTSRCRLSFHLLLPSDRALFAEGPHHSASAGYAVYGVLSAGTKRSANRALQAQKMTAMALSRSDSALCAFYRRLCGRTSRERTSGGPQARPHGCISCSHAARFWSTKGGSAMKSSKSRAVSALSRRIKAPTSALSPKRQRKTVARGLVFLENTYCAKRDET